jgi:hypothetical protein
MKSKLIIMAIFSGALFCGCGKPAVRDLQRDSAFTEDVLRSARFAIGSLALAKGYRGEFHQIKAEIENILWNRMVENIESISLMPPNFTANALAESSRVYLWNHFESRGEIDDKCRMIIRQAASDSVDYFIFARIDEDEIYMSSSGASDDNNGNTGTYYMTTRRIGAHFLIIGAAAGIIVWSGHLSAKETVQNYYQENKSSGLLEGILNFLLFSDDVDEYPDPASMQSVSGKLFGNFANALIERK